MRNTTEETIAGLVARLRGKRFGVVGVGNVLRADDGAGPLVVEALRGRFALPAVDASEVPENYGGWVVRQNLEAAVYIDAVDFGGAPGEVRVIPLPDLLRSASSTHRLSLHYVIEYLENEWDGDAILIGIQPKSLLLGGSASGEVRAGVAALAAALAEAASAVRGS
jgi:hydrogenase 3 maturation protease